MSSPKFQINDDWIAVVGPIGKTFDADTRVYYFTNRYGEVLVFTYDTVAFRGALYHSDDGWKEQPVEEGECRSLILDEHEQMWLKACWLAASALDETRKRMRQQGN